ncbi:MAG TPA: hypothetical protein VFM93_00215 [Candidatus Limnocylindria bacterium]|nr:hypothetical protein [Candidatus Limnocylindria bacterium]
MAELTRMTRRLALPRDLGGVFINVLLRVLLVVLTADSLVNAADERFAGKALGPRNLVVLLGLSLLFPALHLLRKNWRSYPWWFDSVYLSIFFLDMAGNAVNAYNTRVGFDMLPHFYGPGALGIVLMGAFAIGPLAAAGFATMLHALLEVNEIYGDHLLGTKNVRDIMDTANDLMAGIVGATLFVLVYKGSEWYYTRRAVPRRERRR